MFTDMVDYTSLSEKDESLALDLLEEHRKLLRPIFARHGGREVKTVGDGFLVEFASALEAVRCGLEIQQLMHGRNEKVPVDRRILLRVAVNLGDVEHRDGDIYGDAVNIASRVEQLADPSGVWITQQVYDHVRNNREFLAVSQGQSQLKNVKTPFEIYRVQLALQTDESRETDALEPRRIAAMPLKSISPDSQDEYFADGLTEEIINTLSSISGLSVIARTSVMKYRQASKSASEIGRELKVGSILEGSVRKAGSNLRVSVQLIDVGSEAPIWAQRYDREIKNVFEIQTDIADRVADALKVQLLREDRTLIEKKAPEDIAAYVLYLRGRYYWNKRNKNDVERAIAQFHEAIRKDSGYALAYTGLADCYTQMGRHRWLSVDEAFTKAREYAKTALELNDKLAEAHTALGAILLTYDWEWKLAEDELKHALELNANYAAAHYFYSVLLLTTGRLEEAISEAEKAQVLDPLSPVVGGGVIQSYFFSNQYDKAVEECRKYLEMEPNFIVARDILVHLYVWKRMFSEADTEARRLAEASERQAEARAHIAYVCALSGRPDEARRLFDDVMKDPSLDYWNSTIFITLYSIFGDLDNAFRIANRARVDGKLSLPSIRFSPDLESFRSDPRYKSLLAKARLL